MKYFFYVHLRDLKMLNAFQLYSCHFINDKHLLLARIKPIIFIPQLNEIEFKDSL